MLLLNPFSPLKDLTHIICATQFKYTLTIFYSLYLINMYVQNRPTSSVSSIYPKENPVKFSCSKSHSSLSRSQSHTSTLNQQQLLSVVSSLTTRGDVQCVHISTLFIFMYMLRRPFRGPSINLVPRGISIRIGTFRGKFAKIHFY